MNEKSYTELMKIGAMKKEKAEGSLQEMYVEMLLNEIQLNIEKEKLMKKIDESLEQRNKLVFLDLTGSLKELNKRYGA
ncbi:hypothetical protein AM500_20625 [Bacillus sp. FJAT-18017]|uniref:IDEAL domain-containing protein n=1 Tax=unclassified Bacillus (in: firmicutes) TaxID=185979 RepID=UPI0005C57465|nr:MULTISPECIES: IDEAL domain-containing protein [unclassified Bacillus (in: firmicutes)]ALC91925.1 hypothetical protein AM500_20625 [Bacillus sp. FJAT-18017]